MKTNFESDEMGQFAEENHVHCALEIQCSKANHESENGSGVKENGINHGLHKESHIPGNIVLGRKPHMNVPALSRDDAEERSHT